MLINANLLLLRSKPIASPDLAQLGRGEYRSLLREQLQQITIVGSEVSNECLVDIEQFGLIGQDYYYNLVRRKAIADPEIRRTALEATTPSIWLRESVARDLKLVDTALEPLGLRVYVLSGYRSPTLQRIIRELATVEQGSAFTERMLANPEIHLPHATGAAFDLELWDANAGSLLNTKIPEKFGRDYLESPTSLTPDEIAVRDNRRLIHNVLTTNAILPHGCEFIPHPFEYWHYSRHEKLATVFARLYGRVHAAHYSELDHPPWSRPGPACGV
jgi:D-alanyl-D-alanine dipeptidase